MKKTEPIESFPTPEEIKEVFTGDWDRKFNLPELSKEEPTATPNKIEDMIEPIPELNPDNVIDLPIEPKPLEPQRNTVTVIDRLFPF